MLRTAKVLQQAHEDAARRVLTDDALLFVNNLEHEFGQRRRALLKARLERGKLKHLLSGDPAIRNGDWQAAPTPPALMDRRVEITGPVERKMMINALNSGAQVFMADFEDSHSPTWEGTLQGQANVMDAVRGTLAYTHPDTGKQYTVQDDPALLVVRVRGLHLCEAHHHYEDACVSASLFDFGLAAYHNARRQYDQGTGPYFYIPKLESAAEAKWWDEVFAFAEKHLGLPDGSIKATVLIETLPAALQMEEIVYALRDHIVGLNAGRWDYIFSTIKCFADDETRILPDRSAITMSVPFMRAYQLRLIDVCHRRGIHAMGGMSAFIPDRHDPDATDEALAQVRADKEREVADGCDGTWVAHPDLVAVAQSVFAAVAPHQRHVRPNEVPPPEALLDIRVDGAVTAAGVDHNVRVAIEYMSAWLHGRGAVAIDHLMEDAATAEISRCQLWQWRHHHITTVEGDIVDDAFLAASVRRAKHLLRPIHGPTVDDAAALLTESIGARTIPLFLTQAAYRLLRRAPYERHQ